LWMCAADGIGTSGDGTEDVRISVESQGDSRNS
jgi:hypothetical protein